MQNTALDLSGTDNIILVSFENISVKVDKKIEFVNDYFYELASGLLNSRTCTLWIISY